MTTKQDGSQKHTCHKEADEGKDSLASRCWHVASGLVHLEGKDDGSEDLADSHLDTSLNEQCLATEPAITQMVGGLCNKQASAN